MDALTLYDMTKRFRKGIGDQEDCYGMYLHSDMWCFRLYKIGRSLVDTRQVIVETEDIPKWEVVEFLEEEEFGVFRFRNPEIIADAVIQMAGFYEAVVSRYSYYLHAYNAITRNGKLKVVRLD